MIERQDADDERRVDGHDRRVQKACRQRARRAGAPGLRACMRRRRAAARPKPGAALSRRSSGEMDAASMRPRRANGRVLMDGLDARVKDECRAKKIPP
ncbi:hypothetical protein WT25_28190 [Burkholderia territorii]|nr:hypothetical protein WT25_28190 [Burkholderia territorii]